MKNIIKKEIVDMNKEILKHMAKLRENKTIVYPFNKDSITLKEVMESKLGIQVDFFCDDNVPLEKCSTDIMLFCDIIEYKKSHNITVFLSNKDEHAWFYDFEKFQSIGIPSINIVTFHQLKYYSKILENSCIESEGYLNELRVLSLDETVNKRADITFKNLDICREVYNLFADNLSKKVFARILAKKILNCKFYFDIYSPNQYFDKSLIQLTDHEVFFDVGAFNGDTIEDFISFCKNNYNYIYAFEPDNSIFPQLVESANKYKNIAFLNIGLYDKTQKVRFKKSGLGSSHIWNWCDDLFNPFEYEEKCVIKGDALDLKPTFIKMDIEGAEIKALNGLEKTIKLCQPQLAICAYHMPEDLWMVPLFINKINGDYYIYFRHHSYTDSETVCYARKEKY
ncbi:FkbM family methyltransferase [bacterium D16-51]|nr:FkbM family methyltransferase [bacterium D16-59]RKI62728.1 FkbM family methyltransferase [bacterium D16-51]